MSDQHELSTLIDAASQLLSTNIENGEYDDIGPTRLGVEIDLRGKIRALAQQSFGRWSLPASADACIFVCAYLLADKVVSRQRRQEVVKRDEAAKAPHESEELVELTSRLLLALCLWNEEMGISLFALERIEGLRPLIEYMRDERESHGSSQELRRSMQRSEAGDGPAIES